ncbi:chromosome segregation protein SMC [Planctomyces sp. SH-PL14]|uniref:chromosome segregation protein SMC n=1 Tax=Planctomyces sp. SH-PL14 TaxID=1632864 RepID=UPI00078BA247|nr:chromosome segregation protein SMC [Planctomyces sp. SH-PL14]AMV19781.1 Chromosome partition protein Smc [Planctomyces sp. SH-PL14]
MLKSLELFGFKSFADRTLFEFSPGVTCVVGPNGSGKSNVVDGIKWILGDQSAKSLRGKEMTDVIFNGSNSRKASAFAEASLSFDNASGRLPVDSAEVKIGRRLYRSGDSEYLLNGNVVRLKDIRDMFMGTGAGTAAYSIIEQGRVDQILQANPATRRLVFEEAAGISKYKSRKIEAERKLERVAQNLLRLTDIVDEVETQLNSTRSQASKAAKYRELAVELKTLWTGLAADDFREHQSHMAGIQADAAGAQAEVERLAGELSQIEEETQGLEGSLSEHERAVRELEKQAGANREQIAVQESTIRHQTSRLKELEQEIDRLRQDRLTLTVRSARIDEELRTTSARLEQFARAFDEQRLAMQGREEELAGLRVLFDEARARIRETRNRRDELLKRVSEQQRKTAALESQLSAAAETVALAETKVRESVDRLALAERELERQQIATGEIQSSSDAAREQIESIRLERMNLLGDHGQTERRLADLRERRSAAQARLTVLQDLERRQEGLGIGVREILERAATVASPPWSSIVGSVGELVDAALDVAPLIEMALGSRTQLIVVDDAGPLIDYLNRGEAHILGRVGFLELPSARRGAPTAAAAARSRGFRISAERLPDLSHEAGVIARADTLLTESEAVPGLAARLLADTWIVASLKDAYDLLDGVGAGCRFVTQQGELVEADGTLYVGTVPSENAVLSRKSELRQLRNEIIRLDRTITSEVDRLGWLTSSLTDHDGRLAAADQEFQLVSAQLAEAVTRLDSQQQTVARLTEELSSYEGVLSRQEERRDQVTRALDEQRVLMEEERANADALTLEVADAEQQTASIEATLNLLIETAREEQLEFAKHEERLKTLQSDQVRLRQDQVQRVAQQKEVEQRLRSLLSGRREAIQLILRTESSVSLRFGQGETLSQSVRSAAKQRDAVRMQRQLLSRRGDELHKKRRAAQDRQHAAEMQIREREMHLRSLAEKMQEEYQTTLEELAASGVSSFRAYLEEHAPEQAAQMWGTRESEEAAVEEAADEETGMEAVDASDEESVEVEVESNELAAEESEAGESAYAELVPVVNYADIRPELEAAVERLRRRIKALGSINTDALNDLDELESRFSILSAQLQDLQEAKSTLEEIIRRINTESKRLFLETFETIRGHFRELFRKVFGGGEGDIVLENTDDVLECGLDIVARPPGKELRSLTLLSGGEKTMTAVALLFAMFRSKPSPYCILDEVDAALDDANVGRYINVIREFAEMTQFVVITHRKQTMTAANVLYGVTMEQAGVSKRMSVRFEEVGENGEIKKASKAA